MVINRLKSEDENSAGALVSDNKNSVCRIVSLLGLGVAREVSRVIPQMVFSMRGLGRLMLELGNSVVAQDNGDEGSFCQGGLFGRSPEHVA